MPTKIVDLSARSKIIREEPYHVHFWECTPQEYLEFLKSPRRFLSEMGIDIPEDCRIETIIENHDWIEENTDSFALASRDRIICNVGGGDVGRSVYRVLSYGHEHSATGKFEKELLHSPDRESRD